MSNIYDKNHYVENGLCFTEDHIAVHKLFLYNIPDNLTMEELHKHFSLFGRVISVQIFEKFENISLPEMDHFVVGRAESIETFLHKTFQKTGCVLFKSSIDAAKALATSHHQVQGYEIEVLASDSWNQPDPQSSVVSSEEAHIFKIPDDCLSMILKMLPFVDQMHFRRACERFQSVYDLSVRSMHKSIDFTIFEKLTLWDIRDFFCYSGHYVERICAKEIFMSVRNERIFSYLGMNCINLKSMKLKDVLLSTKTLFEIFSNINKLEVLELDMCYLTDGDLLAFKNLKYLKELSLAENRIVGTNLMRLPNTIEKLNLAFCEEIKLENLISMCEALPNLKELCICKIPTDFPRKARCLSLETLRTDISNESQCEEIAKLPKLKSISIGCVVKIDMFNKLFDQLVVYKSEQLEEIEVASARLLTKQMLMKIAKLSGLKKLTLPDAVSIDDVVMREFTKLSNLECINLKNCMQITNDKMLNLVFGCPKLRELRLDYCPIITEQLVHEIIRRMRKCTKNKERKFPIKIYGRETNINVQYCNLIATAKDIVKVFTEFNTKWILNPFGIIEPSI